jgi:tripartite ATP-independent transporter DctM subunit
MSPVGIGAVMIAGLFVLMVLRVPIFLAMGLAGAMGYLWQAGPPPLLSYLKTSAVSLFVSYDYSIVPLFLMMGHFAGRAGISADLFAAANAWVGHRRGGLAVATVLGCGAFGAICGSSIATASTMAAVALPEMRRHGYSGALATGTLAAGGTLGILVPPSIVLIIYAILTEQNIVKLFVAAVVPAALAVAGYLLAIAVYVRLFPHEGPVGRRPTLAERLRALLRVGPAVVIFVIVFVGIYGGYFTPTEGAAIGAVVTGLYAALTRRLTLDGFVEVALETAGATALIFAIVFGADLFNVALALTRVPQQMAAWIGAVGVSPALVLVVMVAIYILLGCVMDSLSMILLTVPIIFPAFMALPFGLPAEAQALWFGILTLIVVELGMITPPMGLNLFVIAALARDVPNTQIYRGVAPFIVAEVVRVTLIMIFPALSVTLVTWVYG